MNRRQFLQLTGLGTAPIAGCSGVSDPPATTSSSRPTRSTQPTAPTPSETATSTDRSPTDEAVTYVSVSSGSAGANGTADDPLDSIYAAVRQAEPGETIQVAPGEYREEIHTQQGGTPGEPITITGPRDAVVRPTMEDGQVRAGSILTINHSHVHLRGLTIDGLADPDREENPDWYADCINVHPDASTKEYLRDLVIMPAAVGNGRGALISMVRVVGVEVGRFEVIGPAGVKHLYGGEEGHNGEIVYLGTAIDNIGADWYGWDTVDETRDVHVHHIDNSAGHSHAELVDAKPGTSDVTIEYCTDAGGSGRYLLPGHEHPSEAAISLSGRDSTLRWCVIENGYGHGVKVDSWGRAHQERFEEETGEPFPDAAKNAGQNNAIYGNRILDHEGKAIRFEMDEEGNVFGYGPDDQRVICGNEIDGETHGTPDEPCPDSVPTSDGIGSSFGVTSSSSSGAMVYRDSVGSMAATSKRSSRSGLWDG